MMISMRICIAVVVAAGLLVAPAAKAQILGGLLGGGFGGAAFGALVGGRSGAQIGALIGGVGGAIAGAHSKKKRKKAERAARERAMQERQQWEQERRQREEQMLQQRAREQERRAGRTPSDTDAGGQDQQVLVVETQKSLVRMGYDPGVINGRMNPNTSEAIKAYQREQNLLETGQVSDALLRHMLQHGG